MAKMSVGSRLYLYRTPQEETELHQSLRTFGMGKCAEGISPSFENWIYFWTPYYRKKVEQAGGSTSVNNNNTNKCNVRNTPFAEIFV